MHSVEMWLSAIPPLAVYALVFLVIGVESMGIPIPGELTLISAALLAAHGTLQPWAVALAASAGAIIGDSLGYLIGRRGGYALLARLGRRFPKHLGPDRVAHAERTFTRWGVWAVFFGRFIALLRILAGPLAGALRMPYPKFLIANATGGIFWATGTTYLLYYVGQVAEKWLSGFSWVGLIIAVLAGIATTAYLRRRARRHTSDPETTAPTRKDEHTLLL